MTSKKQFLFFTGLAAYLCGQSSFANAAPLFESEKTLDVVIEAPIVNLSRQRHKKPEFAGTLRYTDESGAGRSLAINVTTRGKSRLDVCDYPPLKITFDKNETAGTLFAGQHDLKLVRPCMRGHAGRDWVHLELGVYRAYSIITDHSYRARQLNVTYNDTVSRARDFVQPGFFLEDDSDVAKRLNRHRIRPTQVDAVQMSVVETTHNVLFQYLIGNTDFAVKRGPTGEGCCHNGRVFAEAGKQHEWVVVPYDFDYAGIIDTEYALPDENLPIRNVRTRLYRGFCWQNEQLPRSIELFNRKRADIEAALVPAELSKGKQRRVRNYVARFYDIVNDQQELRETFFDKCRGPDSLPLRDTPVSPVHVKAPGDV